MASVRNFIVVGKSRALVLQVLMAIHTFTDNANCVVVSNKRSGVLRFSKLCSAYLESNLNGEDDDRFVDGVNRFSEAMPDLVLIPADCDGAKITGRVRTRLKATIIPAAEPSMLDCFDSKWRFYQFCMEHGLNVPTTCFIGSKHDLVFASTALELGIPFVVKPVNESGSEGVHVVFSEEDYDREIRNNEAYQFAPLIAQRYIQGTEVGLNLLSIQGKVAAIAIQQRDHPQHDSPPTGYDTPVMIRLIESEQDKRTWHEIAESPSAGSMQQCFWWADPLRSCGVLAKGIGIWKEDRLVGGGLFRSIPVPLIGAHLTQCLSGPLQLDWRPEWADEFVSKIDEVAREHNSIEVAIHGCKSPEFHRDIRDALRRRRSKVAFTAGVTDAVLRLENTTLQDVLQRMNKGTRWRIKRAQKSAVEIRGLTSSADLKKAHDAWMATAKRKGFMDFRPWEYLEPVLRHCIDHDIGTVLASVMDGNLLAAIFVTFIGGEAYYVYGGFVDGGEKHSPNHILQFEAIKHSLERGLKTYNFGALSSNYSLEPSGTDEYKLGFGALPVQQLDSIVWKRKPLLAWGTDWLKRQRLGRLLIAALKRRLLDPRRTALGGGRRALTAFP